jgi:Ser/Thr protein kinase RdoA (MazF antagonist)
VSSTGPVALPEGVGDRYGLSLPAVGTQLPGGASGALLRAGEVAVRVEEANPTSLRWEHELLLFLAEEIDEVVAPLLARDGSTFYLDGDRAVSVFPFVGGRTLRSRERSFRHVLPRLLARLHARGQAWTAHDQRPDVPSLRERDWQRNDWWDWDLVEKTPSLVRAFEELRDWVSNAPDLTVCAIHGDFHPGNVLVRGRQIVGVVDWQYAHLDWPSLELAGAVWELAREPGSIAVDPARSETVVGDYLAAGGPGEPEYLRPLMRLESLITVLFSLTRAARGLSWNPEFAALLLATLDELG